MVHGAVIEAEPFAERFQIQFRAMMAGVAIRPQVVLMFDQGTNGIQMN